jgi:hypothetical protein
VEKLRSCMFPPSSKTRAMCLLCRGKPYVTFLLHSAACAMICLRCSMDLVAHDRRPIGRPTSQVVACNWSCLFLGCAQPFKLRSDWVQAFCGLATCPLPFSYVGVGYRAPKAKPRTCNGTHLWQFSTPLMVFRVTCIIVSLTLFWAVCWVTLMINNFTISVTHDTWRSTNAPTTILAWLWSIALWGACLQVG